tara:strand:- start:24 stop:476 length:453 start_codon:yes stop_codon:yes gene_type:complete
MIKDLTSFISGICFIILSIILFHEANQLSPFASVFPYAITSVLVLLSVLLIIRSIKVNFKVEKDAVDTLKIVLLCIVFFVWIYFLERTGFILTSLIAFNLLILINTGLSMSVKKIIIYMITGSVFILALYLGFKTLLLVPLPEGLWFRDI